MGVPDLTVIMKCHVLLSLISLSLSAPIPDDEAPAAPLALPYGALAGYPFAPALPYGALANPFKAAAAQVPAAYSLPVLAYHPLDSGLVYPAAEAYVHDTAGDESDNSYPEAEAYVHDTTGDA